ncbi:hypothetical protein IU487_35725 [Nocardia puris]|uniref:hypothetical protein n=1 Tax=Nocardia puris TaxID=208602 RepID=UPI001893CDAF|nr:hypothetical protein [Nocardia puris]MBF6216341.1 hypothetical protein [Nocardia puris]
MSTNNEAYSPDDSNSPWGRVLLVVVLAITAVALVSEGPMAAVTVLGPGLAIIKNEQ